MQSNASIDNNIRYIFEYLIIQILIWKIVLDENFVLIDYYYNILVMAAFFTAALVSFSNTEDEHLAESRNLQHIFHRLYFGSIVIFQIKVHLLCTARVSLSKEDGGHLNENFKLHYLQIIVTVCFVPIRSVTCQSIIILPENRYIPPDNRGRKFRLCDFAVDWNLHDEFTAFEVHFTGEVMPLIWTSPV